MTCLQDVISLKYTGCFPSLSQCHVNRKFYSGIYKFKMATSTTSGPPYPDLFLEDGTCGRSIVSHDNEFKYNLLSKTFDDAPKFMFPTR